MSKRKYDDLTTTNTTTNKMDDSDREMSVHGDTDEGYETDDTIMEDDYDIEAEQRFNTAQTANKKRRIVPPTPPPMMHGPEPPTEVVNRRGSPLYTRFGELQVPYTSNSYRLGQQPLDKYGNPLSVQELLSINLFKEPRRGGKTKRRRIRKRKTTRRRKSTRRKTIKRASRKSKK
jgi:hypothetical protein